jgi:voltage-gated potassium channel
MAAAERFLERFIVGAILYSVVTYFLELEFVGDEPNAFFAWSERIVAAIFTVEYAVRWIASRRLSYPLRPMAIVDLLALLPFYLGVLVDLRTLRLLRAVRLIKLYRYTDALDTIRNAFHQVRYEFAVIGFAVLTLVWLCAAAMYELERRAQPETFAKFSDALWYTMVTVTTVGYGDKVPMTGGGRFVAAFLMIAGLGLFGTFVSLIGSAFLEELRKRTHRTVRESVTVETRTTFEGSGDFCPASVLRSIDAGAFQRNGAATDAEAVRLLSVACRMLVERKTTDAVPPRA